METFTLATAEGRVRRLDEILEDGAPVLLVFAERSCPTSRFTLDTLARSGAHLAVVSEGRIEAAREVAEIVAAHPIDVLVDPVPHATSTAFDVETVPTLVLVDGSGQEIDRCVGWDPTIAGRLAERAGGRIGETPAGPKPGCASRAILPTEEQQRLEADDAALGRGGEIEEMFRRGWTDGLPVVPPTRDRVRAMLGGRDPDESLGPVPPAMGELSLERLAACAVLAGCEPAHFPVVVAAADAVLDPDFNLHGVQNTTHFATPVLVLSGPITRAIGANDAAGALGPGPRPNVAIGRAIRLMMLLTGGGRPGLLDQSTLGGPHKIGLCIAENEDANPWEPLHVDLGHPPDASVVTVVAGESPAGVSDHRSTDADGVAASLALALEHVWSPAWSPIEAETLLVVGPEHAATFAAAGWSRADLRAQLHRRARRTVAELRATGSGEVNPAVVDGPDDLILEKFADEELITIVVSGGSAGRYSAVIAPWLVTGPGSRLVSRRIGAG